MTQRGEKYNVGEVLSELAAEKDRFRLVIRGFALISDGLDEAVVNAFGSEIPDELSRLRLPARLALAQALGAVTPELGAAIQRLGKIRHRLAHSPAGEVTDEEIRGVSDAIVNAGELGGFDPDEYSPGDELSLAISAIWAAVDDAAEEAYLQRTEVQEALAAYRSRREDRAREVARVWREMRAATGGSAALYDGD